MDAHHVSEYRELVSRVHGDYLVFFLGSFPFFFQCYLQFRAAIAASTAVVNWDSEACSR